MYMVTYLEILISSFHWQILPDQRKQNWIILIYSLTEYLKYPQYMTRKKLLQTPNSSLKGNPLSKWKEHPPTACYFVFFLVTIRIKDIFERNFSLNRRCMTGQGHNRMCPLILPIRDKSTWSNAKIPSGQGGARYLREGTYIKLYLLCWFFLTQQESQ